MSIENIFEQLSPDKPIAERTARLSSLAPAYAEIQEASDAHGDSLSHVVFSKVGSSNMMGSDKARAAVFGASAFVFACLTATAWHKIGAGSAAGDDLNPGLVVVAIVFAVCTMVLLATALSAGLRRRFGRLAREGEPLASELMATAALGQSLLYSRTPLGAANAIPFQGIKGSEYHLGRLTVTGRDDAALVVAADPRVLQIADALEVSPDSFATRVREAAKSVAE